MATLRSAVTLFNGGPGLSWLSRPFRSRLGRFTLLAILAIAAAALVINWALNRGEGSITTATATGTPATELTTAQVQKLVDSLTRPGIGPNGSVVDGVYGHPALLSTLGDVQADPDTLVFFLMESIHEDQFVSEEPTAYLSIDGGSRIEPAGATLTHNDIHHRTIKLTYSVPGSGRLLANPDAHSLSLVIPTGDQIESSANTFTWRLPLTLPDGLDAAALFTAVEPPENLAAAPASLSAMSDALRRERDGMAYGGVSGIEVNVTYAPPEYFTKAFPPRLLERYAPETAFVFVITESTHANDLPDGLPALTLNTSQGTQVPELVEERVTSPHHRVTIVRFDGASPKEAGVGPVSLEFPEGQSFVWALPVAYDRTGSLSPFGVSWASLFAVMAGLIAAMWPCLLQLTVFFIPSLAGLSMEEVSKSVVVVQRFQVVKAALFFILGFTLVYTLAGGLIGFAAQELGESANFETIQRYIGIGGGIIILLLALRVAAKVRAPLVCKMPILSRMGKKGSAKPWEMMLAGLAFATGCMTCFGAALVISMVVYVGLSGSAYFGALILFLFSLGMGIPLLIGALLMTKLLPLLGRMEKWVNRLGLASAVLMVGFAILLISGNYMVLSEWAYGAFGLQPVP